MNYITQDQPFGHTLAELGAADKNIIVIDADLQRATETNFFQEKLNNLRLLKKKFIN